MYSGLSEVDYIHLTSSQSCDGRKTRDQYCKYKLYSPLNLSATLFVMKLAVGMKIGFYLGTKIGRNVDRSHPEACYANKAAEKNKEGKNNCFKLF